MRTLWVLVGLISVCGGLSADETYRVILAPRHHTILSAEVSSTVTEVTKRLGDPFEEGELLLQLDDRVFRARHQRAAAILKQAEANLESQQKLYNDDIASLVELRQAEADAASADAELVIAQKNLDACAIIAPYTGKIVTYAIEEHELAEVGENLLAIVDDQVLIAKLLILSNHLPNISLGQNLPITLDETGQTINAAITQIGAIIDAASSTVEVEAEIDNAANTLKAGMSGYTVIKTFG